MKVESAGRRAHRGRARLREPVQRRGRPASSGARDGGWCSRMQQRRDHCETRGCDGATCEAVARRVPRGLQTDRDRRLHKLFYLFEHHTIEQFNWCECEQCKVCELEPFCRRRTEHGRQVTLCCRHIHFFPSEQQLWGRKTERQQIAVAPSC